MFHGARVDAREVEATFDFNIREDTLGAALSAIARQTDLVVLYPNELASKRGMKPVVGRHTVRAAIEQLFRGTQFSGGLTEHGVIYISVSDTTQARIGEGDMADRQQGHRSFWTSLAALLFGSGVHAQDAGRDGAVNIEEVIVTAQKREERLRDVAGGVSAVTGKQLIAIGAQEFQDYLTRTPGVAFNAGPSNNSTVIIRGVGTTAGLDQGQGTTGYFINDIPMTEPAYTVVVPDVDAFDVNRVEVLRGPQGSLFGSSSLGGAVNYITNLADPGGWAAAAESAMSTTKHADGELGYRLKGMLNAPLIQDKLAARLVVTQRLDPGYVDNVGTGEKGSSDVESFGARGSLVYRPGESTSLTYLGLYHRSDTKDAASSMLDLGTLARSTNFAVPMVFSTQLHGLRLEHDFGPVALTALASWNQKQGDIYADYTPYYGGLNPGFHKFLQYGESDNYAYELRLASEGEGSIDWLVGVTHITTDKSFSESLRSPGFAAMWPVDAAEGRVRGDDLYYWGAGYYKGKESALFGEASWHVGKFTLTAGGRLFETSIQTYSEFHGWFFNPSVVNATVESDDDGFTPKFSIKYQASDDFMVYALASQGYRFGTPNTLFPNPAYPIPDGSTTDKLWNYEVGIRASTLDRKLFVDATVFHIDWDDLQVRLLRGDNLTYGGNAGAAEVDGVETSATLLLGGFTLSANATWLDARLTETVPGTVLVDGQRLPSAAKWRLSNSATYEFGGTLEPRITLLHRYVSESPGYLNDPTVFGSYNLFDARLSIGLGNLTVAAFAENLGDKRAQTFGYANLDTGPQGFFVRPRTFGLQLNWAM